MSMNRLSPDTTNLIIISPLCYLISTIELLDSIRVGDRLTALLEAKGVSQAFIKTYLCPSLINGALI
jgi:hypothetical protein